MKKKHVRRCYVCGQRRRKTHDSKYPEHVIKCKHIVELKGLARE